MPTHAEASGMSPHGLPACKGPYQHSAQEKLREEDKGGPLAYCRFLPRGPLGERCSGAASASELPGEEEALVSREEAEGYCAARESKAAPHA
jgi:hypothetical protein